MSYYGNPYGSAMMQQQPRQQQRNMQRGGGLMPMPDQNLLPIDQTRPTTGVRPIINRPTNLLPIDQNRPIINRPTNLLPIDQNRPTTLPGRPQQEAGYMFTPAYVGEQESEWTKLDSKIGINRDVAVINDEEVVRTPITITHTRDQQVEVERQTREISRYAQPNVVMNTDRGASVTEYLNGSVGPTQSTQEIIQDFTITCG